MPNWVENNFTATGLTSEQQQELATNLQGKTFFANYIQAPDWENTPNEDGELPVSETRTFANGTTHTYSTFPTSGKQDDRWYDWNLTHFGCKWDIGGRDADQASVVGSDEVSAFFLSPWSPPIVGLQAVSQHYPEATFTFTYGEEGNDFAGVAVFRNGQCVERSATTPSDFRHQWWEANHPDLFHQFIAAMNGEDEETDEWEVQEKLDELIYEEGGLDAYTDHLETLLNEAQAELEDDNIVCLSVSERVKLEEKAVADMHASALKLAAALRSN